MKNTKYNLNKLKTSETKGTDFSVDLNKPTYTPEITDHEYKEVTYLQETFENRKFLWYNKKVKVDELVINTKICERCHLPQIAHTK